MLESRSSRKCWSAIWLTVGVVYIFSCFFPSLLSIWALLFFFDCIFLLKSRKVYETYVLDENTKAGIAYETYVFDEKDLARKTLIYQDRLFNIFRNLDLSNWKLTKKIRSFLTNGKVYLLFWTWKSFTKKFLFPLCVFWRVHCWMLKECCLVLRSSGSPFHL